MGSPIGNKQIYGKKQGWPQRKKFVIAGFAFFVTAGLAFLIRV
jgi:hypothetical protein